MILTLEIPDDRLPTPDLCESHLALYWIDALASVLPESQNLALHSITNDIEQRIADATWDDPEQHPDCPGCQAYLEGEEDLAWCDACGLDWAEDANSMTMHQIHHDVAGLPAVGTQPIDNP